MTGKTLLILTAVFDFFVAQAAFAQPVDLKGFRTPSQNIHCMVFEGELRCDLLNHSAKVPAKPKDCEFDWGNAFGMKAKGKSYRMCVSDSVLGKYPILPYGKAWNEQDFHCQSEMSGLTCTNRDRHGFMLKKAEQRLF